MKRNTVKDKPILELTEDNLAKLQAGHLMWSEVTGTKYECWIDKTAASLEQRKIFLEIAFNPNICRLKKGEEATVMYRDREGKLDSITVVANHKGVWVFMVPNSPGSSICDKWCVVAVGDPGRNRSLKAWMGLKGVVVGEDFYQFNKE